MDEWDLKRRTRAFAPRVIRFTEALPAGILSHVIGRQLLRSGTSVSARYRVACHARSGEDFVGKLRIAEKELDEFLHWIDLSIEAGIVEANSVQDLKNEANALLAIVAQSINTAKGSH